MKNLIFSVFACSCVLPVFSYESTAIPSKNILNAARKILPQSGMKYFILGQLSCGEVIREAWSCGMPECKNTEHVDAACGINIDGQSAFVENPHELIVVLKKLKPQISGSNWSITGDFWASSVRYSSQIVIDVAAVTWIDPES